VETITLATMYVLFAVHLGSRRVDVLGVTRNPNSTWVTQQARNLSVAERLDAFGSSSGIGTRSSPVRSTRSFAPKA
jgi:hypothetical protein